MSMSMTPFIESSSVSEGAVLLVSHLSFFCRENDLFSLFNQYAHVQRIAVMHVEDDSRCSVLGCVTLANAEEVSELRRIFVGQLFMGRRLRMIAPNAERLSSLSESQCEDESQVCVSFFSQFTEHDTHITLPNEVLLTRIFLPLGGLVDVCVKSYHNERGRQEGYGVLFFSSRERALYCATHRQKVEFEGIRFHCELMNDELRD